MPLSGPTAIPPIGEQTDPDKVRVAAIVGGQMASAPARGFGLTAGELAALQALTALPDFGTGVMILTVATTSGTYTKPAGLRYLEVWVVGGGGGGSRAGSTAASQASASGGGGGAGVCIKLYAASDLSASEAYTIGAAGTGGSVAGTAGGNTTFKSLTAGGGGGGGTLMTAVASTTFAASTRGTGGSATGGQINIDGGSGGQGWANFGNPTWAQAGAGGASYFAPPTLTAVTAAASAAYASTCYGGGSSGSANGASQGAGTSTSPGGAGCIIFKEFF